MSTPGDVQSLAAAETKARELAGLETALEVRLGQQAGAQLRSSSFGNLPGTLLRQRSQAFTG